MDGSRVALQGIFEKFNRGNTVPCSFLKSHFLEKNEATIKSCKSASKQVNIVLKLNNFLSFEMSSHKEVCKNFTLLWCF